MRHLSQEQFKKRLQKRIVNKQKAGCDHGPIYICRKAIIIASAMILVCSVSAQNYGVIGQPEINGSLVVNGPVQFTDLSNLAPSVGDSMLIINTSGTVGKSALIQSFFTTDGTATGNRLHDFNNNLLTIDNISNLILETNGNWSVRNTDNDQRIVATDGVGIQLLANNGSEGLFFTSGGATSFTHGGNVSFSSTTGALIVPKMTTTQRDLLSPTSGMLIFNTTTGTFQGYTTSWTNL